MDFICLSTIPSEQKVQQWKFCLKTFYISFNLTGGSTICTAMQGTRWSQQLRQLRRRSSAGLIHRKIRQRISWLLRCKLWHDSLLSFSWIIQKIYIRENSSFFWIMVKFPDIFPIWNRFSFSPLEVSGIIIDKIFWFSMFLLTYSLAFGITIWIDVIFNA